MVVRDRVPFPSNSVNKNEQNIANYAFLSTTIIIWNVCSSIL